LVTAIHDATPGLLAYLKAHTPRVPITMEGLHPRVAALAVERHGGLWHALPNITDGQLRSEAIVMLGAEWHQVQATFWSRVRSSGHRRRGHERPDEPRPFCTR
jgi:hypothetical protein